MLILHEWHCSLKCLGALTTSHRRKLPLRNTLKERLTKQDTCGPNTTAPSIGSRPNRLGVGSERNWIQTSMDHIAGCWESMSKTHFLQMQQVLQGELQVFWGQLRMHSTLQVWRELLWSLGTSTSSKGLNRFKGVGELFRNCYGPDKLVLRFCTSLNGTCLNFHKINKK